MFAAPIIEPLGDSAVIVRFGDEVDPTANDFVLALADDFDRYPLIGQRDIVPAYSSLAILYDPIVAVGDGSAYRAIEETIRARLVNVDVTARDNALKRVVDIPVCYDPALAPDLEEVAAHLRLSIEDVTAIHSEREYRVFMIGFTPGFPYLGELDHRLTMQRRATPRARVPAGSVAIGGQQTGVYPSETPGGWWIIGRTPLTLFDSNGDAPSLLQAGDSVRFLPITRAAFDAVVS